MLSYLLSIDLTEWLGILAFFISIVNLYRSLREDKISAEATIDAVDWEIDLTLYNNSIRRITIISFKMYFLSKGWLSKKHYFHNSHDSGFTSKYTIPPHDYIVLDCEEENEIFDILKTQQGESNIFLEIKLSNGKSKSIKLIPNIILTENT